MEAALCSILGVRGPASETGARCCMGNCCRGGRKSSGAEPLPVRPGRPPCA
eukprot:CAMPEP_0172769022 /NCGR_PEP_ID=MMETSP1074-20121228/185855_1 /TAXON_ID=2916 /ORGANISM="Ceratium fusus, Strain PA161109" /LENGTH=50 /DNA_ID=CAMNT_0013604525 /DNA_START=259 /DNA_END=407 /DNA_ORIENTATION=+